MAEAGYNLGSDVQLVTLKDHLFVEQLEQDINSFHTNSNDTCTGNSNRALVFPPISPRYRFLLHKFVEVVHSPNLSTISIGKGLKRRPVIYINTARSNDSATMASPPSLKNANSTNSKGVMPAAQIYGPPPARSPRIAESVKKGSEESRKKISKSKRPDMPLYVPKNRRGAGSLESNGSDDKIPESCLPSHEMNGVDSAHVPLQLPSMPVRLEQSEPILSKETETDLLSEMTVAVSAVLITQDEKVLDVSTVPQDVEVSDLLTVWNTKSWNTKVRKISDIKSPTVSIAPESFPPVQRTLSVNKNYEEGSWDALYDEYGEPLETEALEELTLAVGKNSTYEKPASSYQTFVDDVTYTDEDLNHILEIYDFPATFKTEDLFCFLGSGTSSKSGFDIRWVDDTHALVVFASHSAAMEALSKSTGLAKLRPLSQATRESRLRAQKMSDSLTPWKPRPQTTISMARRMVTSALGLRTSLTPEQRQKDTDEKRKLVQARANRKLASQQREDAWEGNLS